MNPLYPLMLVAAVARPTAVATEKWCLVVATAGDGVLLPSARCTRRASRAPAPCPPLEIGTSSPGPPWSVRRPAAGAFPGSGARLLPGMSVLARQVTEKRPYAKVARAAHRADRAPGNLVALLEGWRVSELARLRRPPTRTTGARGS
ncbi:hypothetical protein [Nonomuraea sp. NPDC049625]|uniref:hypothetical protein n=1 Tax=Nonomuraea sp. NPDC049625 TaxID=3155775 RepID=UPI00342535C0